MRIEEIVSNNKEIQKKCNIKTDNGNKVATLSVLMDISETLALMLDMYGVVHGRTVSVKGDNPSEKA